MKPGRNRRSWLKFKTELKLKNAWRRSIGEGQGELFVRLVPAIEDDQLFVADIEGKVYALDKTKGRTLWRTRLKAPVTGGVGVGDGLVLVGTTEGELIALRQADGDVAWRAEVSSEILSIPQTNGRIVVVRTLDEKVYAFDHETGEQRWFHESILPALTLRGTGDPVVLTNAVVLGQANGKLVVLSPETGRVIWEKRVSVPRGKSELERMTDIDSTPLVDGAVVYAAGFQGTVTAFEMQTAQPRWQKELSSFQNLDEGFGNIYVTTEQGYVTALDATNGNVVWTQNALENRQVTAPTAWGNYVVVGDFEGYLHFMSQVDGHFVARKKVDSDGIRAPMVADGDTLYTYSNDGKLLALKVR